jgi:hypothetical protein
MIDRKLKANATIRYIYFESLLLFYKYDNFERIA